MSKNQDHDPKTHNEEWTVSVPTAGKRFYGLSRAASYDAAARGDLPTIRVGGLLRVPVRWMEEKLSRPPDAATPTNEAKAGTANTKRGGRS